MGRRRDGKRWRGVEENCEKERPLERKLVEPGGLRMSLLEHPSRWVRRYPGPSLEECGWQHRKISLTLTTGSTLESKKHSIKKKKTS